MIIISLFVIIIGIQRGMFASESGLGTSAISSASCKNDPSKQGLCEVFGVSNVPNWLNVAFAAGFGFVLSAVYLVIAAIFHGLRNVIYRLIDVMAEFVTRLIAVLYNKN